MSNFSNTILPEEGETSINKNQHIDAVNTLNVDWKNDKLVTIFVKTGNYGDAVAIHKLPRIEPDKNTRKAMAKKYRKYGRRGLSVMISRNQAEYNDLSNKFIAVDDGEE